MNNGANNDELMLIILKLMTPYADSPLCRGSMSTLQSRRDCNDTRKHRTSLEMNECITRKAENRVIDYYLH